MQVGDRGDKQDVVLHRKTFFDEAHEKLIIVLVSINCAFNHKRGHGAAQLIMDEADSFKVTISEPETKGKTEFVFDVGSCFLEEELQGGLDLRNIAHLKKMARLFIEERAIIKRVGKDQHHATASQIMIQQSFDGSNESASQYEAPSMAQPLGLYTVDINMEHINHLFSLPGQTPRSETP